MEHMNISDFEIEIIHKNIKNIHLSVHPPHGRIRLAAPENMSEESIRLFAISKLSWMKKQRKKFELQDRQSEREFVSGESHYFMGKRYLLDVMETKGKQHIEIKGDRLELHIRPDSTVEKREKVMSQWYRLELKKLVSSYIEKWEPVIDVKVDDWGVKLMKTKWGTCNREDRRIWLNLELSKKNPRCIEYIVVHEMVHILERSHNDRFKAYIEEFLPNWTSIRDELNEMIYESSQWSY